MVNAIRRNFDAQRFVGLFTLAQHSQKNVDLARPVAVQALRFKNRQLHEFDQTVMHTYEIRPRKNKRGVDLISDALPFGWLWYGEPSAVANAIGYAKHRSRSHDAVI